MALLGRAQFIESYVIQDLTIIFEQRNILTAFDRASIY